jgi:hypothetical protein
VKKAAFRADRYQSGFITSFISPIHTKPNARFTLGNAVTLGCLIVGLVLLMRVLVAH